jgi:thiol-disulfide isomerase/thioredoxin
MRSHALLRLGTVLLAIALPLSAVQPPRDAQPAGADAGASGDAEQAYATLWALWRSDAPEEVDRRSQQYWQQRDEKLQRFAEGARDFARRFPHDPRRHDGVVQASFARPSFIRGFAAAFAEEPSAKNVLVDDAALATFRALQFEALAAVIESADAGVRQRGGAMHALLVEHRAAARAGSRPPDFAPIGALVDRVLVSLPDERAVPVVTRYVDELRAESPERARAFEDRLESSPVAALVRDAREKRRQAEAAAAAAALRQASGIADLSFIAADGREVDLRKLRGRVVLIDFWATWCGPCVAEIPNVVAVWDKYHALGFEVVGITLENPGLRPADSPEQRAKKNDAARQKMLSFASEKKMPWPQYFDGQWWNNRYAEQFGVKSIPAMFLLDRQGRVVTTEARGARLESEVRRLLGLPVQP